jgi:hypothetical protein
MTPVKSKKSRAPQPPQMQSRLSAAIPHYLFCDPCQKTVLCESWLKAEKVAKTHFKKKRHKSIILLKFEMQPWYGPGKEP